MNQTAPPEGERPILERGFHFIVVVWGRRFCDYFLDYCLPSMLAPGNIPALRTALPSKFLVATRPDDWERMRATAIFREMERYVIPVFFEMPPCPPGRSGCEHMGIGHKLCCEMAFREKAFAMITTPDTMLSDGTVAHLQRLAADGAELVLAAALRFGEEPFLGYLHNIGAIPIESRQETGQPVLIDGRTMVAAALQGFHSESLCYEWEATYFSSLPAAVWWRVPEENGIIVHSLSWAPLLFDYNAVTKHDTSTLDNWTIDGDYLYKNFGNLENLRIIDDSDNAFLASWGPMKDRPHSLRPALLFRLPYIGELFKRLIFYDAFYSPVFDPLKRRIFFRPVYWHSSALNERWTAVEAHASGLLSKILNNPANPLTRFAYNALPVPLRFAIVLGQIWEHREVILKHLAEIVRGDTIAMRRMVSRLWQFCAFVVGKRVY
jgi:hypothetical protein